MKNQYTWAWNDVNIAKERLQKKEYKNIEKSVDNKRTIKENRNISIKK